jgi:hypothetical protein
VKERKNDRQIDRPFAKEKPTKSSLAVNTCKRIVTIQEKGERRKEN